MTPLGLNPEQVDAPVQVAWETTMVLVSLVVLHFIRGRFCEWKDMLRIHFHLWTFLHLIETHCNEEW